jgi:hypothetical protein
VRWIARPPTRAPTSSIVTRIISPGVTPPAGLARWADARGAPPDVVGLD